MTYRQNLIHNPHFYGKQPSRLALETVQRGFFGKTDRVMEWGACSGRNTIYLSKQVGRIVGIEWDGVTAGIAKRNAHDTTAEFVCADIFCLPFEPDSFTAAFSFLVLQLFNEDQIRQLLEIMKRVCTSEFKFAFALPSKTNPAHPFFDGAMTFFDEESIRRLFTGFGLNIERKTVHQQFGDERIPIDCFFVWGESNF